MAKQLGDPRGAQLAATAMVARWRDDCLRLHIPVWRPRRLRSQAGPIRPDYEDVVVAIRGCGDEGNHLAIGRPLRWLPIGHLEDLPVALPSGHLTLTRAVRAHHGDVGSALQRVKG